MKQHEKRFIKKFQLGNQSIVNFVDHDEINKKVYEGNIPRSLFGPVGAFKWPKIAWNSMKKGL